MKVSDRQAVRVKRPQYPVHGVLLLNKPLGVSSNEALQRVKRVFSAEKTGHTGTLDPLASGLLPLMFGEATKFAADLLEASKTYRATARLGFESSTGDAEGVLTPCATSQDVLAITPAQVHTVLESMLGEQSQIPPIYSALKHQGKPLYEYARKGEVVEIKPRQIVIESIALLAVRTRTNDADGTTQTHCDIEFDVRCSKGTYIRVLAQDIGRALGCGAYLVGLERTVVGDLHLRNSYTPDQLEALASQGRDTLLATLWPVDTLLQTLPRIVLSPELTARFMHGQRLALGEQNASGRVRVYAVNASEHTSGTGMSGNESYQLLGTGFLNNDGNGNSLLAPERLIKLES